MEEKKVIKISLSTFFLILAIIVILVMNVLVFFYVVKVVWVSQYLQKNIVS